MKAAIFDLDGTILDSMRMWYNLPTSFLATQNLKLTKEQEKELSILPQPLAAGYIAERFPLGMSESEVLNAFELYISYSYNNTVNPKPFAREYLEVLNSRGIKMVIATLTERTHVEAVLKRHGLLRFFKGIVTVSEVGRDKTSPDVYLKGAEILGEEIGDIVVFEDALYAMKTAKAAGFTVYAVHEPEMRQSKADCLGACDKYIYSFEELL